MLANGITVARMLLSLLLLGVPRSSYLFAALYLFCGLSDAADGYIARKQHTESDRGARLDSAADLLFALVYAVKILPSLSLPVWIWLWTAGIAVLKGAVIFIRSKRERRFFIEHSLFNKLTGLSLFLLPLTLRWIEPKHSAIFVCALATAAAVKELCGATGEGDCHTIVRDGSQ